jgi:flagellar hook-associated protein 3 FlgL
MLSSLNSRSQAFVTTMEGITQRMSRAQQQLSTGLRVTNVADEPDSVSTLLQARADLASNVQIQSNLGRVKTETDSGEQALQSAVTLMEKAKTLAAQGVTGTATADSRTSIASQIGSIMEEMVGLTATTVEGRYIFSGDADSTVPYTIDQSANPPISPYAGSAATREVQHPNGTRFAVGRTAQDIFDSTDPTKNVFTSLTSLQSAFEANDTAAITAAVPNVATSLNYLNTQLAYYGAVQNRVADATSFGDQQKLQLQSHVSSLQDADITGAIMELNQAQTQQSAALLAQAKMPQTSLFDYLK